MNLPGAVMGVAAGIGLYATLTNGLVGFGRRPRDKQRIAFAGASLAAAVAAVAVIAMYSARSLDSYVAVAKWVFFPASIGWTVATLWFVTFVAKLRSRLLLYALTAGFAAVVAVDFVLPAGILHDGTGQLVATRILGGTIMVPTESAPHAFHYAADVLTAIAFLVMCYAVYRVYRRRDAAEAGYLGLMVVLLAAASLLDTINEHSVITTFTTLYLTQVCFAAVILVVSLTLRRESLRREKELLMYRTRMDALVAERVRELDDANAALAAEARERRATEEALRGRVEELDALHHLATILTGRSPLSQALKEGTAAISLLLKARYARVHVSLEDPGSDEPHDGRATDGPDVSSPLTALDLALVAHVERGGELVSADASEWPGLPAGVRAWAMEEDLGPLLAAPLGAPGTTIGSLVITRGAAADPFSPDERRLARTVCEGLTTVIEIDRLHRRETRQAAVEERQALARDLHDAVTQSIYSATLIAEALPTVYERDPAEGLHNLERLRRLVRAALSEMRTLLFELRPAALEAAPLGTLVERLADTLAVQADVEVSLELDEEPHLPPDVKIALYRVAHEAFNNIAKHARADSVRVRLAGDGDVVSLTVRDDGKGFDPAAGRTGQMGLHIMDERLQAVGGRLTVESAPGCGTTVAAIWPHPASDRHTLETMAT